MNANKHTSYQRDVRDFVGRDTKNTTRYVYHEEGYEELIDADNMLAAIEAAEDILLEGGWDTSAGTIWPQAYVTAETKDADGDWIETDRESVCVAIHPPEPACNTPKGHDWQSPHKIVGGLEENPGVHGHGGGVIITRVCRHCGAYRIEDTWAQRRDTGEQGLQSIEYREADEDSLAWIGGGEN